MGGDAIPVAIDDASYSERTTIELCRDEHRGYRCMLCKGHDGKHEAIGNRGVEHWAEALPDLVDPALGSAGISSPE